MQIQTDYSTAIKHKYPEQVVIAIARDESGKHNPITLGWTMITSGSPQMMAISVGVTRHSLKAIRHAGEYVISFPSYKMEKAARFFGSRSGKNVDKLAEFEIETTPAAKIDSVLFDDAVANFELVLDSELKTGDHVIFAGKVVASHLNENKDLGRLYTLGGGDMGQVKY